MKVLVFNVGASLSCYAEIADKRIVIDLGSSSDISPTVDFLVPLFEKRKSPKLDSKKYEIDQLFLSHPHNDHISDIKNFDKSFYPKLITIPNDNEGNEEDEMIDWELIDNPTDEYVNYLREKVLPGRKPPLVSSDPSTVFLYYIKPKHCEYHDELVSANYANNISLCVLLRESSESVLFPGDLMKDGMSFLIKHNSSFRNKLKDGIDTMITPHHGLRSSFSTDLYDHIRNNKTYRLHIVPEMVTSKDGNRNTDSRYSSKEYCSGKNSFSTSSDPVYQVKTSNGNLFFDTNKDPSSFVLSDDLDEIIELFTDNS